MIGGVKREQCAGGQCKFENEGLMQSSLRGNFTSYLFCSADFGVTAAVRNCVWKRARFVADADLKRGSLDLIFDR